MLVIREERESGLVKLASCCVCLGFISLILASVLPMFVVTSLQGHGKFLVAEYDVDIAIGDGLWKKNVCFGGSRPDESLLQQFGLTCKGSLQTDRCEYDDLTDKEQDHCDQFYLLQGMESLAIFSTFVALFIGSLARSCSNVPLLRGGLRLTSIVALVISMSAASAVIRLVKESDMVDERTFACSKVLNAELCHGYGASFGFQWAAVGELALALMLNFILLCVSPVESTSYQYIRVPLLHQPTSTTGVIIHPPPMGSTSSTQGVVISQGPYHHSVPRAQAAAEAI